MEYDATVLKPILSEAFKRIRKSHGWTQAQMAERLRISPRAYTDLERRVTLCGFPVLQRCYLYCGMTDEDVLALMHACAEALLAADQEREQDG